MILLIKGWFFAFCSKCRGEIGAAKRLRVLVPMLIKMGCTTEYDRNRSSSRDGGDETYMTPPICPTCNGM